jgi:hypothetical protein
LAAHSPTQKEATGCSGVVQLALCQLHRLGLLFKGKDETNGIFVVSCHGTGPDFYVVWLVRNITGSWT